MEIKILYVSHICETIAETFMIYESLVTCSFLCINVYIHFSPSGGFKAEGRGETCLEVPGNET